MNLAAISAAISSFMAIWQVVSLLVPLLKQLVQVAESLFPAGGQGATKLAWVKDEIEKAFNGLDGVVINFSSVWPKLETLVGTYVQIANKAGWKDASVDPTNVVK